MPLPGAGQNIQRAGPGVDHRRGGDSDFRRNEETLRVGFGNRARVVLQEADLPQRRGGIAVGVESVDAVVLGSDEEYVVAALAWDVDAGNKQRLGIDVAIDLEREQLSELLWVHVLGSQYSFVQVGSGAGV